MPLLLLIFSTLALAQDKAIVKLEGETAKTAYESMSSVKVKKICEEPTSCTLIRTSKNMQCSKGEYGVPKLKNDYQCEFEVSATGEVKAVPFVP